MGVQSEAAALGQAALDRGVVVVVVVTASCSGQDLLGSFSSTFSSSSSLRPPFQVEMTRSLLPELHKTSRLKEGRGTKGALPATFIASKGGREDRGKVGKRGREDGRGGRPEGASIEKWMLFFLSIFEHPYSSSSCLSSPRRRRRCRKKPPKNRKRGGKRGRDLE